MGLFDLPNFSIPKQRRVKIPKVELPKIKKSEYTIYSTKVGDRTLAPAKKRKLKEAVGFRCQRCHKKFDPRLLEIHHKKSIASHKDKLTGVDLPVYSWGKKHIPKYDRHKSNLEVVCYKCHDKTKKKKVKRKPNSPYGFDLPGY